MEVKPGTTTATAAVTTLLSVPTAEQQPELEQQQWKSEQDIQPLIE